MKIDMTYDPEANAVYVYLGRGEVNATEEVAPGVVVDYGGGGRLIGIEFLDARETLAPGDWLVAPGPLERQADAAE